MSAQAAVLCNLFENCAIKITATSPRGHWIKISLKFVAKGPIWPYDIIGSGNGLAPWATSHNLNQYCATSVWPHGCIFAKVLSTHFFPDSLVITLLMTIDIGATRHQAIPEAMLKQFPNWCWPNIMRQYGFPRGKGVKVTKHIYWSNGQSNHSLQHVKLLLAYRQISNISPTLVENKIIDHSDVVAASLQLHHHYGLNTCVQWIGQRQLQIETRNISVLGFGVPYIRDLTVYHIASRLCVTVDLPCMEWKFPCIPFAWTIFTQWRT